MSYSPGPVFPNRLTQVSGMWLVEMDISTNHMPLMWISVTEAPHNTDFHTWMGKKHFCFFQTVETGNRTPNSGVKGSHANHYPRAPAHLFT